MTAPLKVIEFFSGIGGWRCALQEALRTPFVVVASYDINTAANMAYERNFADKPQSVCVYLSALKWTVVVVDSGSFSILRRLHWTAFLWNDWRL
jgi:site-specific DNA-cytosine methylase